MGDIPPAVLVAWALYLLLSVLAGQAPRTERRAGLAGVLVGTAVTLKFTVACLAPGLLAIALVLILAGKRRSASVFLLVAPVVAILLYAPWAFVLQDHAGSPVFPLFNAIFQAPRYPATNFQDSRFPVTSLVDLVGLPIRQALGTAVTAELQFTDVRWAVAMLAVGLGLGIAAVRVHRTGARLRWDARLPGLEHLICDLGAGFRRPALCGSTGSPGAPSDCDRVLFGPATVGDEKGFSADASLAGRVPRSDYQACGLRPTVDGVGAPRSS